MAYATLFFGFTERKNDKFLSELSPTFWTNVKLDHYQIIRHKMSYIFSIFECSENGHFLNTLLFLLRLLKSFAFIVH
ncbi:hypothetical protein EFO20_09280 [Lactococcus lactis]|nr:hypothetical protein [Lactococcus lactis]